jgi:hypothetical protein
MNPILRRAAQRAYSFRRYGQALLDSMRHMPARAMTMVSAMAALGKDQAAMDAGIPLWVLWSFILGLSGVWLYAAIRPRYGAGPKTAAVAGIAIWVISCLTFGIGMKAMNLMPDKIICISIAWGVVEDLVAFQLGAWVYKEA